jgi:Ca2+-transporting ATPase
MAGVVVFLVLVLNVPFLSEYLRLSQVGLLPVAGVALLAFAAVSWIEIRKHVAGKGVEGR